MKDKLQSFEVIGLHGYKNFKLVFKDNIIILVGENGSGKTTVLRLLYYLLSGQINQLSQFNFKKIILSLNDNKHTIHSELLKSKKIGEHILRFLPAHLRKKSNKNY